MATDVSSEYTGWRLIVFISVFTPLQIIIVGLRYYARALTKFHYDLGDILVGVALLTQFVSAALGLGAAIQAGVGYHITFLEHNEPEKTTLFFKYLVAISTWYFATISIAKLAVCQLYRTLFPQRPVFIVLCVVTAILVGTSLATVILILAACKPFSANWAPQEVQMIHCLNKEAVFVWGTLPNIITDVVLLAIPLPIVWKLHASTRLRLALTVTFVIGSIGLVASILRFYSFYNTNSFIDATFNATELIVWTIAEPGIYLISASLLVLRPLLDKLSTKLPSTNRSRVSRPHVSARASFDPFSPNNERSITLVGMGAQHGFRQLDDERQSSNSQEAGKGIVVVTDIEQSWKSV
ncbi:hypothetical protein GGS21DRAFT_501572 [Xylaria nigripes]|nr:hypothetical protein GGS21DRAFT_501572 [Xylaria nigripes]